MIYDEGLENFVRGRRLAPLAPKRPLVTAGKSPDDKSGGKSARRIGGRMEPSAGRRLSGWQNASHNGHLATDSCKFPKKIAQNPL
jgi:hypothetical protein